ncbi:hypothetical protein CDAR_201561 [Caerostris darwini]|uniref:Uncharacterized protein n=1 Tax=Caerostris darwini TaxID=1538125 RepID=A0AAV4TF70_9ARAC|nr:hypothetical protein CDAR_201561 [Caerostris darwini]
MLTYHCSIQLSTQLCSKDSPQSSKPGHRHVIKRFFTDHSIPTDLVSRGLRDHLGQPLNANGMPGRFPAPPWKPSVGFVLRKIDKVGGLSSQVEVVEWPTKAIWVN